MAIYYPLDGLPVVLQYVARANPLTYGVNLIRASLLLGRLSGFDIAVVTVFMLVSFVFVYVGFGRLLR